MHWPALGLWVGLLAAAQALGADLQLKPPLDRESAFLGRDLLQVSGTTEPAGRVELALDGTVAQETVADASGAFTFPPLELPHGLYRIAVTAIVAGQSQAVAREVSVDRQPPLLQLAPPWDAEPLVIADRSQPVLGSSEPGAKVSLSVAGAAAETVVAQDGRFRLTLPAVEEGLQELVLTARDSAGNETRLVRPFRLDRLPPVVLLLAPAGETPIAAVEAALQARTEPGTTVRVRVNGSPVAAECDASGTIRATVPLSEGDNQIAVEATDEVGNRTVVGQKLVRDTTAPALRLEAPLAGGALRTADVRLRVAGQTESGRRVTLMVGGRGRLTTEADLDGRFVMTAELAEGRNTLLVSTADAAGNLVVAERQVVLDRQPPLVQIVSPGPVDYIETARFALAGRSEPGARLTLRCGAIRLDAEADAFGSFELADIPLVDGLNGLVLTVADDLGNTSVIPVTVAARLADPFLELQSPTEGNQAGNHLEARVVHDADVVLSAWLDDQPLPGWRSSGTGERRQAARPLTDLAPGDHELRVVVASPSGLRRAAAVRRFHIPGPVRSITLRPATLVAGRGAQTEATITLADEWGAPVADGTAVVIELPQGWSEGGSLVRGPLTRQARGGQVVLRLGAEPKARSGTLVVRAGRLAEAFRFGPLR